MDTKHAEFLQEGIGLVRVSTLDDGVREAGAYSKKLVSALRTLEGNGWHFRNGKWVPPDESAEAERIIAARSAWLGVVLLPVVVSYDQKDGGPRYEQRVLRATWTDKEGRSRSSSACEVIHPNVLRDSLQPDKLRHNVDNALRNKVTEIALREYYLED